MSSMFCLMFACSRLNRRCFSASRSAFERCLRSVLFCSCRNFKACQDFVPTPCDSICFLASRCRLLGLIFFSDSGRASTVGLNCSRFQCLSTNSITSFSVGSAPNVTLQTRSPSWSMISNSPIQKGSSNKTVSELVVIDYILLLRSYHNWFISVCRLDRKCPAWSPSI